MSCFLKQSTAVDVMLGPFLDETTGKDIEGGLTITQPDIRLSKNGGAFAQKSAAQTLTHGENGWYPANLSTTDTNTLGILIVAVHESGALPVWREFLVVPANVYDSFFSTDLLQVDLAQWLGLVPNALTSGSVPSFVNVINTDAIQFGTIAADTGLAPIRIGTCTGGTSNSITLSVGSSSTNDFYRHTRIYLTNGTGAGQSRLCTAYNGTTRVATVEPDWIITPVNASTMFVIRAENSTPAIATGGIAAGSFAAGAIDNDALAADMDSYTTRSWIGRQGTTADKYIVQWFKNGQLISTGITVPLIRVFDDTGTNLIAETAMTEIGSEQCFKFIEATNTITPGEVYIMQVKATINGAVRIDRQPVTRDSA